MTRATRATRASRATRATRATGEPAHPPDPMVGSELELDVLRVATGGVCVARSRNRVVFVRHALPGERVRALVVDGTVGRPLWADALEVLGPPSPDRVEPPCPEAGPGRCGGCDWQHVRLPAQRRLKAEIVREQLLRLAGVDIAVDVEGLPEVPGAPGPGLGWRTRMQYAVGPDDRLGLRRARSHDVHPLPWCPLSHPRARAVGVERRPWPGAAVVEVVVSALDRAVVVTPRDERAGVEAPELPPDVALLRLDSRGSVTAVRGRSGVREQAGGREWQVGASGFWQVHPAAADTLTVAVLDALAPRPGDVALDLYAGVGLFAAALADRVSPGGRVIAVEADSRAADDARHNLAGADGVGVRTGRVAEVLRDEQLRRADLVVLDPPRAGAGPDVLGRICAMRPRRVAYVACDPASLARDVASLQAQGYRLRALRAFDLFPMTRHVECVAVFEPAAG